MLKKERFSLGNNGSTLVEVIVSVLIVGIAFIPLMMGLNAAMNTNKQTENKLFAEAACDNVVEVCKTYGSSGLIGLAGGSGEGVPSFSGEAIKKLSDVFSGWDVTYSSGVGGVTNFTVTGITEGDRGYTALVEFDPGPYKDGQNNYDNYQMIGDIGYAATVTFVDDPVKKIAKYFCDKAQVTAPDVKLKSFEDTIGTWLDRQLIIGLAKDESDPENVKYDLFKRVIYSFKPVGGDIVIDGHTFSSSSFTPMDSGASTVGAYNVFPENIIIIYSPIKRNVKGKAEGVRLDNRDRINIYKNDTAGQVDVYCLCQKNGIASFDTWYPIEINVYDAETIEDEEGNTISSVSVYANQVPFGNKPNGTGFNWMPTAGSGKTLSTYGKMKDVKVEIYAEEDTTCSNTILTKKSTVVEYETK